MLFEDRFLPVKTDLLQKIDVETGLFNSKAY